MTPLEKVQEAERLLNEAINEDTTFQLKVELDYLARSGVRGGIHYEPWKNENNVIFLRTRGGEKPVPDPEGHLWVREDEAMDNVANEKE